MAFEADGGGGEDALERTAAVRADGDLGIREFLDFLCVLVAGGAFVFVERHEFLSLSIYCDAGRSVAIHQHALSRRETVIVCLVR